MKDAGPYMATSFDSGQILHMRHFFEDDGNG